MFNFQGSNGLKKWGNLKYDSSLAKKDFIDIESYIRLVAGIPEKIEIWDKDKISTLVYSLRKKISQLTLLHIFIVLLRITTISAAIALVVSLLLKSSMSVLFAGGFSFCLVLISATSLKIKKMLRQEQVQDLEFYCSADLSMLQKKNALKALEGLRLSSTSLYTSEIYEKMYKISDVIWIAPNWFLISSGVEEHRKGIYLSGQHPSSRIFVPKSIIAEDHKQEKSISVKKKFLPPKNYSALDKHARFAPYLKCILREKKYAEIFVEKVSSIKKTRGLTKARTRLLNTVEFILGEWKLWISYIAGELSGSEQTKYEKQLIDKLNGDQTFEANDAERINDFVNGKLRQYEDWIIWLDIIPPTKVEKSIEEYLNLKKK